MAVSLKWTHGERLGQGQRLEVGDFGVLDFRSITPGRDLTEKPQGIGLMAAFSLRARERQHPLGEGVRLLRETS